MLLWPKIIMVPTLSQQFPCLSEAIFNQQDPLSSLHHSIGFCVAFFCVLELWVRAFYIPHRKKDSSDGSPKVWKLWTALDKKKHFTLPLSLFPLKLWIPHSQRLHYRESNSAMFVSYIIDVYAVKIFSFVSTLQFFTHYSNHVSWSTFEANLFFFLAMSRWRVKTLQIDVIVEKRK